MSGVVAATTTAKLTFVAFHPPPPTGKRAIAEVHLINKDDSLFQSCWITWYVILSHMPLRSRGVSQPVHIIRCTVLRCPTGFRYTVFSFPCAKPTFKKKLLPFFRVERLVLLVFFHFRQALVSLPLSVIFYPQKGCVFFLYYKENPTFWFQIRQKNYHRRPWAFFVKTYKQHCSYSLENWFRDKYCPRPLLGQAFQSAVFLLCWSCSLLLTLSLATSAIAGRNVFIIF